MELWRSRATTTTTGRTLDLDARITGVQWLTAHRGSPGDERRVLLSFRHRDIGELHFEFDASTAGEIASELARCADADDLVGA